MSHNLESDFREDPVHPIDDMEVGLVCVTRVFSQKHKAPWELECESLAPKHEVLGHPVDQLSQLTRMDMESNSRYVELDEMGREVLVLQERNPECNHFVELFPDEDGDQGEDALDHILPGSYEALQRHEDGLRESFDDQDDWETHQPITEPWGTFQESQGKWDIIYKFKACPAWCPTAGLECQKHPKISSKIFLFPRIPSRGIEKILHRIKNYQIRGPELFKLCEKIRPDQRGVLWDAFKVARFVKDRALIQGMIWIIQL